MGHFADLITTVFGVKGSRSRHIHQPQFIRFLGNIITNLHPNLAPGYPFRFSPAIGGFFVSKINDMFKALAQIHLDYGSGCGYGNNRSSARIGDGNSQTQAMNVSYLGIVLQSDANSLLGDRESLAS